MLRLIALVLAFAAAAGAADSAARLERVVLVVRHGVRPPTQSNAVLAKYAAQPWPEWPVAPGELTPHGGETVKLVARAVRATYVRDGLLPREGCARAGEVSVWADNADQRTRESGRIFAGTVQPGCDSLEAHWSAAAGRDPIFTGSDDAPCKIDPAQATLAMQAPPSPAEAERLGLATARLQAILAPDACSGGPGTCFAQAGGAAPGGMGMTGFFPATAGLSEDLLLEYVDGKPMSEVGWGKASAADIATVMALHEHAFDLIRDNAYVTDRRGATMARIVLSALAGTPVGGGPQSGPEVRMFALTGHDTNLAWMGGVFGLTWTLPDNPDFTAPSTTLAFEVWKRGDRRYVRPVVYYATLDQLRTLHPADGEALPLRFKDCDSGPNGSCPLETVRERVLALLPPGCGEL
jgi:4-phytase/acid phosphatase